MDSKLRTATIVTIVLLMLTIFGVVILMNIDVPNTAQTTPVSDQSETIVEVQKEKDLSAFMWDDMFFDDKPKVKGNKTTVDEEPMEEVSMYITSVEKDIRIQVLDSAGKLLQDKELYVELDNGEEYKDLDRDGVIYIPDLKAGDYYVTLGEVADYRVPESGTKVRVKDKVTYTEIKDISLLIKTEEEIDAEKEDSAVKEAKEEADDTEIQDVQASTAKAKFGIDISKWNEVSDWDKVAASGVDFVVIRVGYRGSVTGALVEDPNFRKNIEGAQKAGIKVGLYFFTQAVTEVEAVEEASMVLALCADDKITYPIFIDTEGAGGNGRADNLDKITRTAVCAAFCETIESAGYDSGVYASRNWYNNNLDVSRLDDYVIWLAEYTSKPAYKGKYQMWQYTSSGSVDGIEGRVDLNLSYLKYE